MLLTLWTAQLYWLLLQGIGIPSKYISIRRNFYTNITCRIRTDDSLSDPFTTTSGVRQGCVAAPNLNEALDYWISSALARTGSCHSRITDLCYADEIVMFADLIDTISDALAILQEEATPLGLTMNWAKTKVQSLTDFLPLL